MSSSLQNQKVTSDAVSEYTLVDKDNASTYSKAGTWALDLHAEAPH